MEFRDAHDAVLKKIEGRWIAVEGLTHRTVGTYPDIRLSARKEDIGSITCDRHVHSDTREEQVGLPFPLTSTPAPHLSQALSP